MNILFLYPKPVEGEKRRKTRLEHQLACLSNLIQKLLADAVIEQNFSVRQIAYQVDSSNEGADNQWMQAKEIFNGEELQDISTTDLSLLYQSSDLVIEICGDKRTQSEFYNYAGATITIRPTYPGSFAQNDIDIDCKNIQGSSWITEQVISATRKEEAVAKVSEYVDPDMYYSQFSPLPYRLGKEFYSRPREHALVFLSFSAGENNDAVCDSDQKVLSLLLHDLEPLRSLTIVTDNLATAPKVNRIASALNSALGINTRVFAHRRGDYRDLFSVLSKCDLALFAGSSLYVDAIRLGVPAYIWRSRQKGVEILNNTFLTLTEEYEPSRVLQQQRSDLENLIESHYLGHTLPNNSKILISVLAEAVQKLAPGVVINTEEFLREALMPVPVIDQPRVWHDDSISRRLKNSLSSGKKKFTKLKQNPNRFLRDSENTLAQKIYTLVR